MTAVDRRGNIKKKTKPPGSRGAENVIKGESANNEERLSHCVGSVARAAIPANRKEPPVESRLYSSDGKGDNVMKKLIDTAFVYACLAMAGGVFYREFTKFNGFQGRTALGLAHTHWFMLGMFFFLAVALLDHRLTLRAHRKFGLFYLLYNLGVMTTAGTLIWRGVLQVLASPDAPLSKALDASISGVAGIGHLMTGTGIVLFFLITRSRCPSKEAKAVRTAAAGKK